MSVTTTYKCDRCLSEQTTSDQFWVIRILVHTYNNGHDVYGGGERTAHWCRKCVEAIHLLAPHMHNQQRTPLPAPPTFEEMLREIVRDEIQSATGTT